MKLKAYGLTGNIGCGKSTVSKLLAQYPDVVTVDCDALAKAVMNCYTLRSSINEILGVEAYPDGLINRKAIADVIFSNPEKKQKLESLVHPFVWMKVEEVVGRARPGTVCIVESAIIFEKNDEHRFDGIIVAACPYEEQVKRLIGPRGIRKDDAERRIAQQMSSEEKERRAQFVIRTDCTLKELESRVARLYKELQQHKGEL